MISVLLVMVGTASAKEVPSKQNESQVPTPTIADVKAMLPVKDLNTGFQALEMLKRITQPELALDKASLLVAIYESQNTAENDNIPESPGQPTMTRQLQIGALVELTKIPTEICVQQAIPVLQNYYEFMNSPKNPLNYTALIKSTHPRRVIEPSMAALVTAHIDNPDIRAIGSRYLVAPAFSEMTKGRIATALLAYQVERISDKDDPNLTQRLTLVMETACLPSLEQMLKAPKRVACSANILITLTDSRSQELDNFIKNKGQLSDSQKYFIAYASLRRVLQKIDMKKSLLTEDIRLVEQAEQWRLELVQKTQEVKDGDQLLEQVAEKWKRIRQP